MGDFDVNDESEPRGRIELAAGTLFANRFRLESPLGMGGMGAVYRATELTTGATVALKILKRSAFDAASRFEREVEILNRAHHPGIIGIQGFGHTDDGTAWLAMEYVEGETLRARVEREGKLDPRVLSPILVAACDALTSAHERGVVHRDLKPDHLFLPRNGVPPVKILDFGLSLTLGSKKLTKTGTVVGTPRYMAPEQIASAHASDGKVDVYALGVIVYEALTGNSPFAASDHGQLLGAILQGRVQPLSERRPDLPFDLVRVVELAMSRSTDERWPTPNEFAHAFDRAVRGQSVDALVAERKSDPVEPRPTYAPDAPSFTTPAAQAARSNLHPVVPKGRGREVARIAALVVAGLSIVTISALLSYFALR